MEKQKLICAKTFYRDIRMFRMLFCVTASVTDLFGINSQSESSRYNLVIHQLYWEVKHCMATGHVSPSSYDRVNNLVLDGDSNQTRIGLM
jgi:hypothetical protein